MANGQTGGGGRNQRSIVAVLGLAAAVLVAIGVTIGWLLFADDGSSATRTDLAEDDLTTTTQPSDDEVAAGATTASSTPTTVTTATAPGGDDGATGGDGESTTTVSITTDTVEPDEATDDGDLADAAPDEVDQGPPPTARPTSGSCSIALADLNGQGGVVSVGDDGACGALQLTLLAVTDQADLAATDWAADVRLCQKHPSAAAITVAVTVGGGPTEVTDSYVLGEAGAGTDPIEGIEVAFPDGFQAGTGVQPIVVCRTDDAELVLVHRPRP